MKPATELKCYLLLSLSELTLGALQCDPDISILMELKNLERSMIIGRAKMGLNLYVELRNMGFRVLLMKTLGALAGLPTTLNVNAVLSRIYHWYHPAAAAVAETKN